MFVITVMQGYIRGEQHVSVMFYQQQKGEVQV